MKMRKTVIFLATNNGIIDSKVEQALKKAHGKNIKIQPVRSRRVFTTDAGLSILLQQNVNTGIVYVNKAEVTTKAYNTALDTGIPFGILFKNRNLQWETFRLNAKVNTRKEEKTAIPVGAA